MTLVGVFGLLPQEAGATHYPTGSLCYDCHAVSKAKMVVGTHMIKRSQKTVDLGITGAASTIRCLFCHEPGAVSVGNRTTMNGVWDHFNATSTSKHGADVQSTTTQNNAIFDCLDCHNVSGVLSDGTGNANVHGKDASTQPLTVESTLTSQTTALASLSDSEVSTKVCGRAVCHGASSQTVGDKTAPATHAFATSTLNDGAAPSTCTQCHGKHNSYQGTSLIVLRTNGTVSNLPPNDPNLATQAPLVTPDLCGECHNEDDGGATTHQYATAGHGKSGVGLSCTNCHSPTVAHDFKKAGTNPFRFSVAENKTLQSTIRQQPPYNQVYSICLNCHAQYASMVHGGTTGYRAGCNDCHEPHGDGIGANIRMIREQIPKVNASGAPIYGDSSLTGTYDTNAYTGPATGTGASLCDNAECHQGRLANGVVGKDLYPLTTFLTGGRHSGGDMATSTLCESCHKHSDPGGGFGAVASCDGCHGNPPATNAHIAHKDAGIGCASCHPGPGVTAHNGANITSAAAFATTMLTSPATIRNQVDVAFTGAVYTTGAYLPAKGSRVGTTYATDGCTTGCHGATLPAGSQTTAAQMAPEWNVPASGACGTCHKVTAASAPTSGSHQLHAGAAPNRAFGCQQCHYNTTTDGTTIKVGGSHVDGNSSNDILGGGTFAVGGNVSMSYTDATADATPNGTCSTITCHGGYANTVWGAAVNTCSNCHGVFPNMVGVVADHKLADWSDPKGDGAVTRFDNAHKGAAVGTGKGEEYCDYCHANTLAVYTAGVSPSYNAVKHMDGQVQVNTNMAYAGVSGSGPATAGCASACHAATTPYVMADSAKTLQPLVGQGFACGACHRDGTLPPTSGAHLAHGADNDTDYSECEACHGNNGGLGFANTLAGTHGIGGAVNFAAGITYTNVGADTNVANDTCSTTQCHSIAPKVSTWGTPTSVNCDHCHYWAADPTSAGNNASGQVLSSTHNKHFDAAGTVVVCNDCHADATGQVYPNRSHIQNAAGTDGAVLADRANATQDEGDVLVSNELGLGPTGTDPDPGNPTCNNRTCHNPSYANAANVFSATWGATNAVACAFCHVATTGDPKTGDHTKHIGYAAGYAPCTVCHGTSPAVTGHMNRGVTLATGTTAWTYSASLTPPYDATSYGKCTAGAGACHVVAEPTPGNIAWGGTAADCGTCHPAATDTNNYNGQDKIASDISNGTEWTTYGHGAKGATCVGAAGCHDIVQPHDTTTTLSGANPYRLRDQDGVTAGVQFSCTWNNASCHDGVPTASVATVRSHTPTDMIAGGYPDPRYDGAAGGWGFLPACVNCHDPHGDGANLKMVQKQLYDKAAFTLPAGPAPAQPTEQTNLTFTDLTTGLSAAGTSYVDTTNKSNICQECHEGTPGTNTTKGFVDGHATAYGNYSGHPGYVSSANDNPTDCGTCHKHSEGFRPGGCNGCHGGSLAGEGNNNWWPDGAAYPDRAGDHQQHIDAIYAVNSATLAGATATDKKNNTCNWCHPNPGAVRGGTTGDVAHNDNVSPADVHGDGRTGAPVTNFKNIAGAANGVQGTHNNAATANGKACSNVDCHYRVTTPTTGTATAAGDGWYQPLAVATCSNCHGSGTAGAALPNAHPQHVGNAAGQRAYPCTYCHPNNGTNMSHQTGVLNWTFAATLDPGSTRTETYNALATGTKAPSYGAGTYSTCANVYCHIQTPSPAWNATIGATQCTLCHQTGQTAAPNPSSGLHYGAAAVTVSGTKHDDTLDATNKCAVCHTQVLTQSTHANGTFEGGLGQTTQMGLGAFTAYTQTADNVGTCVGAGAPPTGVNTGCHAGAGDAGTWARKWDSAIHYATNGAECAGCHGGMNETDWTFGSVANTTDGSVEHNRDWNANTTAGEVIGNHQNTASNATKCNICHVYADSPYTTVAFTTYHRNGSITMNSAMGYSRTAGAGPAFGCTTTCHSDTNSGLETSGWALQSVAGPALTCTSCHGATSPSAGVGSTSTHTAITSGGPFAGCEACHPGGTKGAMHQATSANKSVVGIPRYETAPGVVGAFLGLDSGHSQYIALINTTRLGIVLGGNATIGTNGSVTQVTEAEICWACHATAGVSEWGTNTNANTGNMGFDYGAVTNVNWTLATWSSGIAGGLALYKSGPINSVHTANPSWLGGQIGSNGPLTGRTTVAAGQIRCSYCHDVHGRTGAMAGPPYLRGSWRGNPYTEDMAPRLGLPFGTTGVMGTWGAVPRGSATKSGTTGMPTWGGYQIDQNNPTAQAAMGTAAEFGGLCELCHGNGDGTFAATEIDSLNVFGTMTDWVSTYNGHKNAVKGASGVSGAAAAERTARNIFNNRMGTTQYSNSPFPHYIGMTDPGDNGSYGFRGATSSALKYYPYVGNATGSPRKYRVDGWIGTATASITTTSSLYHQFSCSKCHNPHASRLPRLMISNCLDTKHNTWDNYTSYRLMAATGTNLNRSISNWTSAQNCHRVGGVDPDDTRGDVAAPEKGWNNVTPW